MKKIIQEDKDKREEWRFYSWWKKILYVICFPVIMAWIALCWFIMITARGIYQFGDFMSGWRWNNGNWSEDI